MSYRDDYLAWARKRMSRIQADYLNGKSYGRETLAKLRDSWNMPPCTGHAYRYIADMPNGNTPLREATWYAFSLYGFHQQGEHYLHMQEEGVWFNEALRRCDPDDNRIQALFSAKTVEEIRMPLLSVITMMRNDRISFDHALLAWNLYMMRTPERYRQTMSRWRKAALQPIHKQQTTTPQQ